MKYLRLVLILCMLPSYVLAQNLSGTADISYNKSWAKSDGEKTSTWSLFQTYYLNYSSYLTPALTPSVGIRYSRKDSDMPGQEIIYPFVNLGLNNKYVSGNLSYNYMNVKTEHQPGLTNSFWSVNLASQLTEWPKMNFQYTQSREYDEKHKINSSFEHEINIKSTSLLSGVTYQYSIFDMMYNYMRSTSLDYITETDTKSNNHIARLGIHKTFWKNRISFSADGGYNYYGSTTTVPEAGEIEQKRVAKDGFYGVDSSPEHSSLSLAPNLIDGNQDVSVLTVQEYINVGVDLFYPQTVDTIYIYTNKDYAYEPAIPSEMIEWAVYYSNEEGQPRTWTIITSNASFSYDETYHRFEISFTAQEARYFKVVYYPGTTSPSFQITEIEIYGLEYVEQKSKSVSKTYTGNCNLSIRPLKRWTTAYYLSYYRTDTFPEANLNYTLSHGASIIGDLSKYFLLTLSYQRTRSRTLETITKVNAYTFNWRSNPLETLNTTLTLSHTETKENEELISKVNNLVFNSIFMLWKGIDVNWNFNLSHANNVRDDTKSFSVYSDLYLRALLTKTLSWDIGYDQSWQRTSNEETIKTTYTSIYSTLVYTPSSRLYGRIFIQYSAAEEEKRLLHEYSIGCFITPKVQINATSSFTQADIDQMTHSIDINWNIAKWASFRMGYSYSHSNNDITQKNHNIYSRFSANF